MMQQTMNRRHSDRYVVPRKIATLWFSKNLVKVGANENATRRLVNTMIENESLWLIARSQIMQTSSAIP
jgi:hypothetical protein